jgi:hypothetical protein
MNCGTHQLGARCSARSITSTSIEPRADSSFSPSCSCSAVKIDGFESSVGEAPGGAAGGA